MLRVRRGKSQSAMEYLMTYGWAILAIAIVMVSLYSLGIFNTGNLQPTATPGSCEVVRTAAQTSLAGQCSNLIPKYVGKFNGQSSKTVVGPYGDMNILNAITTIAWFRTSSTANQKIFSDGTKLIMGMSGGSIYAEIRTTSGTDYTHSAGSASDNKWHQYTITYLPSDGSYTVYLDGAQLYTVATDGNLLQSISSQASIGSLYGTQYFFNGSIADMQIYNTSLDAASIKTLYQEGIGGIPSDIQHLVAWYPLNGNANDYSGNNNQGIPTNVIWDANWESAYTAPTS